MKYYIADLHFGDAAVIDYSHRPFRSVEEMDEVMIENWNERITDEDDVYIIGDLIYRSDEPLKYLNRLNGRLHLIQGNHDKMIVESEACRARFVEIVNYAVVEDGKHRIVLFHYPILEWEGFYYGTWHIHGHIHNHPNRTRECLRSQPKTLNAGVDITNFQPVTFDELVEANRVFFEFAPVIDAD